MPLARFKVRNEFGLGRPELYGNGTVEDEDPKAVLGGVTVAGLVGILRQLGDLAEFAAEVFHGIQEQVTVTASRSQKLTSRVRRIESALSPLEKAVLSQTSHIHLAYTTGCEWHPRIQNGQNHFICNDLPLFVMESYEQCRDPPRLHLLDKFDVGGPGSCLRRYSDPTYFRKELNDPIVANDIKVQRDKSYRKSKKKRLSQRKIPRSRLVSTSEETSGTHPSSLTDDRQTTSQSTSTVGMACISNMQELSDVLGQPHLQEQSDAQEQPDEQEQSNVQEPSKTHDSRNDSGYIEYIEYLMHHSPMSGPKEKLSEGFLPSSPQHVDSICSALAEGCTDVVDDNIQYGPSGEQPVPCAPSDAWDEKKETPESLFEQNIEDEEASEILEYKFGPGTPDKETQNQRGFDRMDILFVEVDTVEQATCRRQHSEIDTIPQCESEGENQSERESETESRSEADEYVDARNTIESESENDLDGQPKQKLECYLGDVNIHCSEDNSKDNNDKSADIPYGGRAQDPEHDHSRDESCSVSYLHEDEEASCSLSVPVPEETVSRDKNFQEPGKSVATFCSSLAEAVPAGKILREEPVATYLLSAEAFPDERISPEESVAMYPSLAEAVPHKKISSEELVVVHPLLAEAFPDESPEEPVATDQFLAKAIPQEKIAPEEPIAMHPLSAEAFLDERISPEESISMSPSLAEAVPHKQILQEEPVAMYPLLAEVFPDESPEEPVPTDPPLAKLVPHEKFSVEEPFPTYPWSAEVFPDEMISPEEPTTYLPLAEAVPHKKAWPEKSVAMDPLLAEAIPDERISPEEPVAMDLSLAEAIPHDKISPEEPVATYPSSAEAVPDVKNSSEDPDATYPSSAEAVPDGKILPEAPDATCCPDEDHATDEPHTASDVLTNKETICDFLKSESTERIPGKTIPQVPGCDLAVFDPRASSDVDNNLKGESLVPYCSPSISGNTVLVANCPLHGGTVKSCPDARESLSNDVCVESVTIWSNGSLLGLEPSKPPVFAVPNSVNGDIENANNGEASVKARGKEPSEEPVESNEKASDPSSQHSNGVSYSIGSHQQSTAVSFGVFGLSHRLLMNGFRRNLSACNYESLPASSNTEVAMEDETEHGYQETRGSTYGEPFGCESLFESPISSPPLEHMTISFSPIDGFAVSKLRLKIPSQPQYHERGADMFPLFQLVPETASPHNKASDSEDDNDTFCRSSPCISVSCCSEHSLTDSELWESDGNPEKDGNLYDALRRISPGDSISSFEQVGDRNTIAGIGMEPSLSGSFLDIPCFDAINTSHAIRETQNFSNTNIHQKLPSHIESSSSKLLGSLEQDNIPEPESCGSGDGPRALPNSSERASGPKIPKSTSFAELPVDTAANGKQFSGEATASTSEAKQSDPRRNSIKMSPPTNANKSAVLEKANTICQAVATDEEED